MVCDTRSIADTPQAVAGRMELTKRVLAEGIEPVAAAMLPKLFGPETVAKQLPCIADTGGAIDRASPAGVAAALGAMAGRPDMTASLADIRVPTLVVVGEHDVISPVEEMRGIAERIPGAEFVVIPGAGHMSPLENPAAFNAALENFCATKPVGRSEIQSCGTAPPTESRTAIGFSRSRSRRETCETLAPEGCGCGFPR